METERDTLELGLAPAAGSGAGKPIATSFSSWSRSEEEANFLSLDMAASPGSLLTGAGGARGGFPEPPGTTWPALSYITSFSLGAAVFLKGARREIEREIFLDFCRLEVCGGPGFSPAPGLLLGMSATAVACRNTERLLAAEVPVPREIADWPFSLSLELMLLVRLPGIFFLEMICLAELVVALLPVLFTRLLEL